MRPIPAEAREGLQRAWLAILSERHPSVTWVPDSQKGEHEPKERREPATKATLDAELIPT